MAIARKLLGVRLGEALRATHRRMAASHRIDKIVKLGATRRTPRQKFNGQSCRGKKRKTLARARRRLLGMLKRIALEDAKHDFRMGLDNAGSHAEICPQGNIEFSDFRKQHEALLGHLAGWSRASHSQRTGLGVGFRLHCRAGRD